MRKRAGALSFLGISGIVLYAAVVAYIGWEPIAETAQSVDFRFIAAVMAVEAVALSLRALKWRIVCGPNRGAAGVFFLSKAGGNLSPARVGELSPLLLRDYRNTETAAWILADRVIEVAVTLSLGAIGVLVLSTYFGGIELPILAALIGIAAMAFVVAVKPWRNKRFQQTIAGRPLLARTANTIRSFMDALMALRSRLPVLTGITILAKCLDLTVALLLYRSMGHLVPYAVLAAAQCVHGLTTAFPLTPSFTGVPYATAAAFIHETAAVPIEALTFAIPLRMAAAGSVFWILFGCVFVYHRHLLATPFRAVLARFTKPGAALPIAKEATDELG